MTTITPARDAVLRANEMIKTDLAARVARGDAVASDARMTEAIVCAAMLAWADEADRGLDFAKTLAGLEAAFANAISSSVRTVCNREGWKNQKPVFESFMERLAERVADLCDERPPNVSVRTRPPDMGHA